MTNKFVEAIQRFFLDDEEEIDDPQAQVFNAGNPERVTVEPGDSSEAGPPGATWGTGTVSFFPEQTPRSLIDFAGSSQGRNWSVLLRSGAVFIHDKRPVSDRVIEELIRIGGMNSRVERSNELDLEGTAQSLTVGRSRTKPFALVVDGGSNIKALHPLLERYRTARRRRDGLWVRGYVDSTPASTLRLFDVIIVFDMAEEELERVRSVVALNDDLLRMLRGAGGTAFLIAVTVLPHARRPFPILTPNPHILSIGGESMREEYLR